MNIAQIENKLKLLVQNIDSETYIYDLLEAYYLPKASVSRLHKGSLNLSKVPGEVSWKKKLFFNKDRCYRSAPFNDDDERLEYLVKLCEKMIAEEQARGTLFESNKKKGKKK